MPGRLAPPKRTRKPSAKAKARQEPKKAGRSSQYREHEVQILLDLTERYLPYGAEQWEDVAYKFNSLLADTDWEPRDGESLRLKFKKLKNVPKPTGTAVMREDVYRAKQIARMIDTRTSVSKSSDDEDEIEERDDEIVPLVSDVPPTGEEDEEDDDDEGEDENEVPPVGNVLAVNEDEPFPMDPPEPNSPDFSFMPTQPLQVLSAISASLLQSPPMILNSSSSSTASSNSSSAANMPGNAPRRLPPRNVPKKTTPSVPKVSTPQRIGYSEDELKTLSSVNQRKRKADAMITETVENGNTLMMMFLQEKKAEDIRREQREREEAERRERREREDRERQEKREREREEREEKRARQELEDKMSLFAMLAKLLGK